MSLSKQSTVKVQVQVDLFPHEFTNLNTELAFDFPGGKHNRNTKIRAQLRILKFIAIVKKAS